MNDVHLDIIKGNAGEIGRLAGSEEAKALGVDSVGSFKDPGEVVKGLARKESTLFPHRLACKMVPHFKPYCLDVELVVAMSGVVDYVSDGKTIVSIQNGHHYQGSITGSGCMATTSIAVLASVAEKNEYFIAAVAG
jgi:thiamine-phosphate diphosphorylase/hydroxyethylthiazole kinase